MSPSWEAERLPPGKTWAEGKELDVHTRWRRRIWFEEEMRRILGNGTLVNVDAKIIGTYLALGRGSATVFFGLFPDDMYCFSRVGGAIFGRCFAANGLG